MNKSYLVIGAGVVVAAVVGISLFSGKKGPDTAKAPAADAAVGSAGNLNIYNWTDYIPDELIKKFENETKVKVTLDLYDTNETLLAKLKAGGTGYDIIVPSHNYVPILINENLIQKVDVKSFENYKYISDSMKSPEWDKNQEYTIPYQNGTTGFLYLKDKVPGVTGESWKEFFEPSKEVCGKLNVFKSPDDVLQMAQIYLGIPQCSKDAKEMQKVQDLLVKQKKCVKIYSSENMNDRLKSGEVVMSNQWDGNAVRAVHEDGMADAVYAFPKEGILAWADNVAIPTGAVNVDNAKKFMNFLLKPENMAMLSNFSGYQNSVPETKQFLKPALQANQPQTVPAGYKLHWNKSCEPEAIKLADKVWAKVIQ